MTPTDFERLLCVQPLVEDMVVVEDVVQAATREAVAMEVAGVSTLLAEQQRPVGDLLLVPVPMWIPLLILDYSGC